MTVTMLFIVGVPEAPTVPGRPVVPDTGSGKVAGKAAVSLDQAFFDEVIASLFYGTDEPAFPVGSGAGEALTRPREPGQLSPYCDERLFLLQEGSGVQTAAVLRKGMISVPIAFRGNVSVAGICISFSGWSDSSFTLRFDESTGTVFGEIEVQTVNIDGVPAFATPLVTSFVQNGINRNVNPVTVIEGDQLRFKIPVEATGRVLDAEVQDVHAEILEGRIELTVEYTFNNSGA